MLLELLDIYGETCLVDADDWGDAQRWQHRLPLRCRTGRKASRLPSGLQRHMFPGGVMICRENVECVLGVIEETES